MSREVLHRHDNVTIVKADMRRCREVKSGARGANLLDREIHDPVVNVESQSQANLPEFGVDFLYPVLETRWIEGSHVASQDYVNELSHCFTLLL
jgi:hypothetical protein